MYIKALFEVDEKELGDSSISTEFGWVAESGIYLLEYEVVEI